jgi:hypothetical protein
MPKLLPLTGPDLGARAPEHPPRRSSRALVATVIATCLGACQVGDLDPPPPATDIAHHGENDDDNHDDDVQRACDWSQMGGDPEHTGAACREASHFDRISAHLTFDPFVAKELADSFGNLLAHFQAPLLVDNDVYMELKSGTYNRCNEVPRGVPCGRRGRNTQVWTERAFHWSHGELVADWTFASDWKPASVDFVFGEPMFHAAVAGAFVYVPGASGSLHKLDRRTGLEVATIRLPGVGDDPRTFVAGGLAVDRHGNVYYNALALAAGSPFDDPRGAWLVKVTPDDTVKLADFATIALGAPAPGDACVTQFSEDEGPWPPSPDAVPPSAPCGAQRPPINVTPAVGEDGSVVTISTASNNPAYTFVVEVDADLAPKWAASLRDKLHDGCGVLSPANLPPTETNTRLFFAQCRVGATVGVDPSTNLPPAGSANDQGTSSPVILPDGGVLYGAFTGYNQLRGHLFKFDKQGAFAGTYDFGWDVTPAVYRHHGTYSIITKDNRYFDEQFFMTQLDANLHPEWTFQATNTQRCQRDATGAVVCTEDPDHPTGFEWCVNAPAVDRHGNVYVNSEDGWVYKIAQGGRLADRMFLLKPLGAAYTPIALDARGRLFALDGGDMFVIDRDHRGAHAHD